MQVSCPECSAKLQLSAAKLPDHPFIIKCPKCECGFQVTPEKEEEVLEIFAAPPAPMPAPAPLAPALTAPVQPPLPAPPVAPMPQVQPPVAPPSVPVSASSTPELNPQIEMPTPAPPVLAPPAPMPAPAPAPALTAPVQPPPASPPPPVQAPIRPVSDLPTSFSPGMAAVGFTNSMPAPTAWDDSNTLVSPAQNQGGHNDLLQALTSLLLSASGSKTTASLPSARRRFVTSCLTNQESFARVKTILGEQEYYVTAAESPDQVTSLLQSSHQLDILLLDPAFHSEQQGGASIMRYLNMLNPARRRRVFVVVVSQTYKTMDTQAAFSHGVNMIVNSNELEMLPNALAHSIGDFNNLYRAFNVASGIAPF